MGFRPNDITREHILLAVSKIDSEKLELRPSTKWDVIINGKQYPPKEIMRYAHEQMNGEKIWEYGGGEGTNKFFLKFGFEIHDKVTQADPLQGLIDNYKKNINQSNEELYKWELLANFKGRPNLASADLLQEFKSINYSNLIHHLSIAVIHQLAKESPEQYRSVLKFLFDEKIPINERIKNFPGKIEKIYREIEPNEKFSHHHDERTMATLLTFYNPEKYAFFKDSFYKKFCKLIDEKAMKKNEKYPHYLSLIQDFIDEYIANDKELIDMVSNKVPRDSYRDPEFTLLAQDILYQNLDTNLGSSRRYWRIGTTEGEKNTSQWEVMKNGPYVSIGWKDLGDLREKNIKNKKDIEALLKQRKYYKDNNGVISRKAGEIYNFYEEIKPGDVILAQEGFLILGIGIVEDDYEFDINKEFTHVRSVEWKLFNPQLNYEGGPRTTVYEIEDLIIKKEVDRLLLDGSETNNEVLDYKDGVNMSIPLNQIIYGPPGTGKTHKLITKYFPKFTSTVTELSEEQHRKDLVAKYTWWQIVSAAVFALKKANVTQILSHPFVLAKISVSNQKSPRAMLWSMLQQHTKVDCTNVKYTLRNEPLFFEKDNVGIWTIDEKIIDNDAPEIKEFIKAWDDPKSLGTKEQITYYDFVTFHQSFCYEDFIEGIKPVLDGDSEVGNVSYTIEDGVFKKICDRARNDPNNKYALFIDEINRGNVSQIFGEFITLIEEDKREWEPSRIKLTLAYSKKHFSVPPNLHIIGTMNTADRSIEALDTALRRRFSFEELLPDSELIKTSGKLKDKKGIINGIDLGEVLRIINKRIEKLKDKDHMIGHSYFLNVETMDDLKLSFQRHIFPLLQEYFFGDYGKIGLVIGSSFFENKGAQDREDEKVFADFNDYESYDLSGKPIYRLVNVTAFTDEKMKEALINLLRK